MIARSKARRGLPALGALLALLVASLSGGAARGAGDAGTLRVCADPDYLPYSTRDGRGFENKIAEAMGRALGRKVSYTWASTRGPGGYDRFLRTTLRAGLCDLVVDVPYASNDLTVTRPYYVSSYVFVYPKAKHLDITSMDSPALKTVRIGFETETPAETGLKLRALIVHADPFEIGDEAGASPALILDALRAGKIAVAVTWEPSIGYFLRSRPELTVVPVPNSRSQGSPEQYVFPMAMATRPGDTVLAPQVERAIAQHKAELQAILNSYGVKLYPVGTPS